MCVLRQNLVCNFNALLSTKYQYCYRNYFGEYSYYWSGKTSDCLSDIILFFFLQSLYYVNNIIFSTCF